MSSHSENGGNTGIDPKVARIYRFDVFSNANKKRLKMLSHTQLLYTANVLYVVFTDVCLPSKSTNNTK